MSRPWWVAPTELDRLDAALEETVTSGHARLLTVLGAPGVGKTRLVEEALGRWSTRATIAVGSCPPYGRGVTYWPLREAILAVTRDATERDDGDAAAILRRAAGDDETVAAIVDDVLGLVGLRPGAPVSDGTSAVRALLERLARRRPVVVVLDDMQWAEPGLFDLVEHVLRWWSEGPLLLVAVARPELLERRPDWPGLPTGVATLGLEPLDADASAALAQSALAQSALAQSALAQSALATSAVAGPPAPATLSDRIARTAGGNPLFIEELAAQAVADSRAGLEGSDLEGAVTVGAGTDADARSLPATIRALLASRLDRLPVEHRIVLQRGSVVGESFERGSIVALTPADERADLPAHLLALLREDLLHAQRDAATETYAFRHLLLRDAAYESLPKRDRAELHEILAAYLEEQATARGVELAEFTGYHLERAADLRADVGADAATVAGLARRAATALHEAGLRAQARGDVPGAVNLLTRAAGRLDGDARQPLVLGTLGAALTESGDLAGAREVLDRAVAIATERDDGRARTHAVLFRLWLDSAVDPAGWTTTARAEAEHAIAVFTRLGDDLGLARAWVVLAEVRWSACRFAGVEEALRRATVHARAAGDLREEAENVAALTFTAVEGPLPVPEGIARCHDILAGHAGNRSVHARALRSLALLQGLAGDADALATMDASLDAFRDLGQTYWLAVTTGARGRLRWWLGDASGAEADLRDALARLGELGERSQRARVAIRLAEVLAADGRADEALRLAGLGRESADVEDLEPQIGWRVAAALAHVGRDAAGEARTLADEAVALAEPTDALLARAAAADALAVAAAAAGDPDAAAAARADAAGCRAAKQVADTVRDGL